MQSQYGVSSSNHRRQECRKRQKFWNHTVKLSLQIKFQLTPTDWHSNTSKLSSRWSRVLMHLKTTTGKFHTEYATRYGITNMRCIKVILPQIKRFIQLLRSYNLFFTFKNHSCRNMAKDGCKKTRQWHKWMPGQARSRSVHMINPVHVTVVIGRRRHASQQQCVGFCLSHSLAQPGHSKARPWSYEHCDTVPICGTVFQQCLSLTA